ncbi:type I restriction enzyme HsdR N-terminal domain-containing protein [Spirulina sp. CS-785/01]|uniref:type I restriction enzyme HsdR N-terminal domain-containing protein n=1 Tax=Spirulina sp. CS-785/01 TaxID=3021716 RepID=UPI00232B4265|nr:type I restriction enzyme HsdR N-terminal domain-containing protein [Spirulina sp. CS-785/01]MDB9315499.1 type I restriction enzyme HsdR N-terminal domain-containing protein [Spirulina sp. CS-785/01]
MVQSIPASEVQFRQLKQKFDLQRVDDPQFFPEWSEVQISLSDSEQQTLDRVKENYSELMEDPPMLENTVKMVVLSPLLDLAGFYRQPFQLKTEPSVALELEDAGKIIRGRIDVLVERNRLWLLVIESKRSDFSAIRAIPQALAYMLSNPQGNFPTFGLIATGSEFLFLKTVRDPTAQYGNSRLFSLINPGNELYLVLQILKDLGQRVID